MVGEVEVLTPWYEQRKIPDLRTTSKPAVRAQGKRRDDVNTQIHKLTSNREKRSKHPTNFTLKARKDICRW